jgi:VWFA-related protein
MSAPLGAAQQQPSQPGLIITTGTNEVLAPTTVMTRGGAFVNGLDRSNFEIYDNDKRQELKGVEVSFIPISLVVAIQKSAQAERVLPTLMKIGSMLEGVITGDQGETAIVQFDHRIEVAQPFTNDTEKLKAALAKLRPGSNTSKMNDAVMTSARMLRHPSKKDHRKIILLISETMDRGSEVPIREVLYMLENVGVIVYPVNMSRWVNQLTSKTPVPRPDPIPVGARPMPPGAAVTPTTVMQNTGYGGGFGNYVPVFKEIFTATKAIFIDNPQEKYAKYTGGKEYDFVGLKGLEEALSKIGEELHSQYLLTYSPSAEAQKEGGWHRIQVKVNRPGLEVRTRGGYWAAAKFNNPYANETP